MNIYQWLCVLGVPGVISLAWGWAIRRALAETLGQQRAIRSQNEAIREGLQALLRDRLLQGYRHYAQKGWADYDDRANMENIYAQYHSLGQNGVMDEMRKRFLALPHSPEG